MNDLFLTEQEQLRRDELRALIAMGIDPYPAELFEVTAYSQDILDNYEEGKRVSLAGRVKTKRIMGKASFVELRDTKGDIQVYIGRDIICPGDNKDLYNEVFKRLISIGDIIGIEGELFTTQTGEISVRVSAFKILCKILRPITFSKEVDDKEFTHVLTNPEMRYRMRYLDLILHPEVRETFRKRTKVVQTMRDFLNAKDYLEVETPILQPIHGGAAARPFMTHHNALDMTLYLRIANELYLKRLVVGGFDGVYEFSKDFRNEGMSRFHNPEFTQIELYVAYKDYYWMMDMVEEMIEKVAIAVAGTTKVTVGDKVIDFKRPWKRYTMYEAIQEFTGFDISEMDEKAMLEVCAKLNIKTDNTMGRAKLIDEIFGETCEHQLIQPTFIMDYPEEMSPLTKKHRSKPGLVERFEAICNGKEICNAYSELNDPLDQRRRFEEQLELAARGDEEAMALDEDFLRALEYGMPPTSGIGIGIDRLSMIMTNSPSIQDVLFFPHLRPEAQQMKSPDSEYLALGIPQAWIAPLQKSGIWVVSELKEANPNKLFQDLCGINKKYNLGIDNPKKEEVESWCK